MGQRLVWIGRVITASCLLLAGFVSAFAQTSATAPPDSSSSFSRVSRFDLYTGYQYFYTQSAIQPTGIRFSSINYGAIASGAYYFTRRFGLELTATGHPDGGNDQFYTGSLGPIFRIPHEHYTLFVHGSGGAARIGGPNKNDELPGLQPLYFNANVWAPSFAAGGGIDIHLPLWENRFSFRLIEADYRYIHADFGTPNPFGVGTPLGGTAQLHGAELSSGLVVHFGNFNHPPALTYSCTVSPAVVYPGDPVSVTGTALNVNPKKTVTYNWSSDGGTVSGNSSTANVDTKIASAGTYTVKGHVSAGKKPTESADCTASYTIKAFEPPTISCSASPPSVSPGDSSMITASAVSPQNRPLTYSYNSTAGSISGTTGTATLSTAGAAAGTITVTCNVVDDKGQTASSTTSVTVAAPPAPPAPSTSNLCSINFDRDPRRPARVNNEAKACLDDIALNLQRTSDAKIAIVGNTAGGEKMGKKVAAERVINTKAYLVKEKGIDASRITLYTGTDDGKTVTTTLVPPGATLNSGAWTTVDETAPMPKKRHKK